MKKFIILVLVMLSIITTVNAIVECDPISDPIIIPCRITSTWNYTPPCNSYTAFVYNETGQQILNYTFSKFNDSMLCNFTWHITEQGSYTYRTNNGDTGLIKVEVDTLIIDTSGNITVFFLTMIWLILLILCFTVKGKQGNTPGIFLGFVAILGLIIGISWMYINVAFGLILIIISLITAVGKSRK